MKHPVLTPAQLLDQQMDLLIRLDQPSSPLCEIIEKTFYARSTLSVAVNETPEREAANNALAMATNIYWATKTAEAFYVTEDLAAEVVRRAEDENYMPGIRQFDRNDAPVGAGLVYIEGGLPIRELRGRVERAHWIVWGPSKIAISKNSDSHVLTFWCFNDSREPDEVITSMDPTNMNFLLEHCGRFVFQGADFAMQGERVGKWRLSCSPEQEEILRYNAKKDSLPNSPSVPEGEIWWTNTTRLIVALWDLLNESVNVVSHGQALLPRPVVRRAKRMNLPGRVTVVRLRRAKYVDKDWLGHTAVDWQHRWIVRRHRRLQPCGPGRTERRVIWIESHEKGPKDRPLIQTEKVYRLDR